MKMVGIIIGGVAVIAIASIVGCKLIANRSTDDVVNWLNSIFD